MILAKKIVIVLNLRGKSKPQILEKGLAIVEGISQNPVWFPNPQPALGNARKLTDQLMQALTKAASGNKVKVSEGTASARELGFQLRALANYVERIARANSLQAETIARLANMEIRKQGVYRKPLFNMLKGPQPGTLILRALAGRKYFSMKFELTTTPDIAESWKTVQNKTKATARAEGLTPHTRYFGRCFRTDKTGTHQIGEVLNVMLSG
jgi:hypothetical protein